MSSEGRPSVDAAAGLLQAIPWDRQAFGFPCYEIIDRSALAAGCVAEPGHYTAKVDPLSDTRDLHEAGFYYCDTLMEPYCRPEMFRPVADPDVTIADDCPLEELLALSQGAYRHGRYHRDFNVADDLADLRYDNWIRTLYGEGSCFGLLYRGELAAYFATSGNKVVLHAVAEQVRGKGLAKYLWSAGYGRMFGRGFAEVCSSVSAANTAVVNLYASLGFRFRNPVDVYHKFVSGDER